jgi:hypothetical protein
MKRSLSLSSSFSHSLPQLEPPSRSLEHKLFLKANKRVVRATDWIQLQLQHSFSQINFRFFVVPRLKPANCVIYLQLSFCYWTPVTSCSKSGECCCSSYYWLRLRWDMKLEGMEGHHHIHTCLLVMYRKNPHKHPGLETKSQSSICHREGAYKWAGASKCWDETPGLPNLPF